MHATARQNLRQTEGKAGDVIHHGEVGLDAQPLLQILHVIGDAVELFGAHELGVHAAEDGGDLNLSFIDEVDEIFDLLRAFIDHYCRRWCAPAIRESARRFRWSNETRDRAWRSRSLRQCAALILAGPLLEER